MYSCQEPISPDFLNKTIEWISQQTSTTTTIEKSTPENTQTKTKKTWAQFFIPERIRNLCSSIGQRVKSFF